MTEKVYEAFELEQMNNKVAVDFLANIALIMSKQGHSEINRWNKAVQTEEGGVYLLQFVHVQGPKINLNSLYAGANSDPNKIMNPRSEDLPPEDDE